MARQYNYEVGDYVRYEGNMSTLSAILRDPDYGRIESFETLHDVERINLYLIGKKQNIWCDFQDIRMLLTEPEHLSALGFITIDVRGRKKYIMGAVTISGAAIMAGSTHYVVPYCVGDLSNGIANIEQYYRDGEFSLDALTDDYPDVNNINDLLTYLESQGRQFDKEAIISI